MKQMATCLTDQQEAVTLGSVVAFDGQYGVVWHATSSTLRVLRMTRGMTAVRLSLANEVALHLPVSLGGWFIAYDELVAWPRQQCSVVGEINERCLLKTIDARSSTKVPRIPAGIVGTFAESAIRSARG
ncbi:MAG TPA: hypothetical protein VKQ27_10135 [Acetobacteraceae bacterium]|nr:hypothetical protein [Acetobacteraceae bacterium]